jgi:hypothetical protein
MRRRRDTEDEMADPRFRLDLETADRVLAGRVAPDDAPPGYAEVAGLLQTLAGDLPSRPAAGGEATIRMMAKVVGISDPPRPRRRPLPLRGPLVALTIAGSLGTTGVAFAGGLPDAAQRVVSTWFEKIGVTIPRPDDAGPSAAELPEPDPRAAGHDAGATGPAPRGTMAPHEDHRHRAAEAAAAPPSDEAGDDVARPSSDASRPPAAAPNHGGTGTADDASGGASPTGTSIAEARSVGRSSAGSANAASDPNADDALTNRAGAPPDPDAP